MTLSVAKFFKDGSSPLGQARPTFPPPLPLLGGEPPSLPPVLAGVGVAAGLVEALEEDLAGAGLALGGGLEAAAAAGVAAACLDEADEARLLEGRGLQRFVVPLFLLAIASC